ncbi:response regulator transcription factor [Streptomyces sp. KM273126]|uniref:response regulator transcription factor n=1 Tax=Streptomyces sp. KM273126 TaxID=2545247 RepID=UPI00104053C6|nr:response regulator transcription factor [Streptomyces sp. KM273126]MBA2809108.1 response regulator transcription factor [Streptomyces sp. KM273126]
MKRVLVVEPHPQVMAALADLVTEAPGCELVGAVATVCEAISLVSGVSPDVVLVDTDTPHWPYWPSHQLGKALSELLPMAALVFISTATEPYTECPEASATTPPISILKTAVPEFLRSLTA